MIGQEKRMRLKGVLGPMELRVCGSGAHTLGELQFTACSCRENRISHRFVSKIDQNGQATYH
jgi:hypothetical protein